jgi:hypothetical protein
MGQGYAVAGIEPPLEELLDDPIARLIMRRDGIEPADVWRSIAATRARLAHPAGHPSTIQRGVDAVAELSSSLVTDGRIRPSAD